MKVSKNFETDGLIISANELVKLAREGESIYVTKWKRLSPASFILGMQFRQVMEWINSYTFYKVKRI